MFHRLNDTPGRGFVEWAGLGITLALLLILLAGCDLALTSPEPLPTETAPEITPQVEPTFIASPGVTPLVFWEPFALDRPQGILLSEMVRDFQIENPDIAIEVVAKSGYVGIHGAMEAGVAGGELPDLSVVFPSMIAQYASAGIVAPLDAYIQDPKIGLAEEELADFFPGFLEGSYVLGYGRQFLSFPFVQNAIGMWVNDTLLAQAGWNKPPVTWDQFEQACYDVYATTGIGCYPYIESVSTFNAWLYSRRGQQLDAGGQQATFNGPAGVESLAMLRRLIESGLAWRPESEYGDYLAFVQGQAAFTFSSTGAGPLYAEAYDAAIQQGAPPFEWHQTMIPQSDPQNPATVAYGANFFVVSSNVERERSAWRFIRWFTAPPQSARWSADLQAAPVRLSAVELMTDTRTTYPFYETQVQEILPYTRPEPAAAAELTIRDILYTAILSVTQGLADPQTALNQAAAKANAVLAAQP